MNKKYFLKELEKNLGYDSNKCLQISNVLDDTFLVGKKNKEKMINAFMEKLNIDEDEANNVYETVMNIIKTSLKEKIKHPFKSID